MQFYYKLFLYKEKLIKNFFSGMMLLSGMELSANEVEVQKNRTDRQCIQRHRGEKD